MSKNSTADSFQDFNISSKKNGNKNGKTGMNNKYNIIKSLSSRVRSINYKKLFTKKNIIVAIVILGLFAVVSNISKASTSLPTVSSTDSRIDIKDPTATQVIQQKFEFPILDTDEKEVTKLTYEIESVELRDEIIVKGQKAVAVKGRTFLILNIKITNNFDQAIDVNVRNYVRLSVNGNKDEMLAADIHNDPVTVQALSTKNTRLGYPVNDNYQSLMLTIGEIKGEKKDINLNF